MPWLHFRLTELHCGVSDWYVCCPPIATPYIRRRIGSNARVTCFNYNNINIQHRQKPMMNNILNYKLQECPNPNYTTQRPPKTNLSMTSLYLDQTRAAPWKPLPASVDSSAVALSTNCAPSRGQPLPESLPRTSRLIEWQGYLHTNDMHITMSECIHINLCKIPEVLTITAYSGHRPATPTVTSTHH